MFHRLVSEEYVLTLQCKRESKITQKWVLMIRRDACTFADLINLLLNTMKLSDLHTGERGVIVKVYGHGGFRKRIVEMGFVKGKTVKVVLNAPLKDPIEYELMGYKISLRREEAKLVEVISESEAKNDARLHSGESLKGIVSGDDETEELKMQLERRMEQMAADKRRVINVALVGNPNCGKTSLFNVASGGHEHVGNYSGVTVDAKEGFMDMKVLVHRDKNGDLKVIHESAKSCDSVCSSCSVNGSCGKKNGQGYEERIYHFRIVDLPGTYSLSAYSPEELYVRRHLIDKTPDIVINVVDSSNLERNLYLTTQLIDMHQRMVVALNMFDELQRNGDKLDYVQLGHLLGVPMIPTISRTGKGIRDLFETVIAVYENQNDSSLERHIHVNHGAELEHSIDRLKIIFQKNQDIRYKYSTRYLAIKFLEGDSSAQQLVESLPQHDELVAARYEETQHIKEELHDTPDNAITDAKYGFIQGALKETYQPHAVKSGKNVTEKIDKVVTNRYLGFPLFFIVLFLIFFFTFQLGSYPMDWIDWLVSKISDFINYVMPNGILKDMIVDGAISGVGAVIVFLPNIMILYLFISILEDTGYMARAAFIMDKLMHRMGLHGKSFIPMVMGFGCNVPAIMATRTIENPKSRLITMLITPFMSCSARIPIYVVLVSAFFPQHGAVVMLGLYALGIAAAIVMARVFSKFLMKGEDLPFVMELPPYRMPTAKSVVLHTWEKGRQYLQKMGGIILVFSLIIWALNYFPHEESVKQVEAQKVEMAGNTEVENASNDVNMIANNVDKLEVTNEDASNDLQPSYLQRIGHFIAPVMAPMHFDWKMSVGILSGIGAKELVVSTLSVMYAGEDVDTDSASTDTKLSAALRMNMTQASALAYLVFILFYFPCIATITAIKNESGGWKWAIFTAVYTTGFAYVASFVTYLIASRLLG